jgi:hypothetical protein
MNTGIRIHYEFPVVVASDATIYPVNFKMDIRLNAITMNSEEHSIAIHRLEFFMKEIFRDSLIIEKTNPALSKLKKTKLTNIVVELPGPPVDQLVGLVLFNKLQAIIEHVFVVDNLEIIGDKGNLHYTIEEEIDINEDGKTLNWWDRSDITVNDDTKHPMSDFSWDDVDLEFPEYDEDGEIIVIEGDNETE